MASAASLAFDREAAVYDETFGRNPVGLVFRHVFQERLKRLFPPGARVLDLGCGTGEDAVWLAGTGVAVHAIDPAPGMVERARAKASALGLSETRLRVEQRAAEDVAGAGRGFDGAYSDFGALNCADLTAVGSALGRVLRPGAPLLLSLLGPWPLPVGLTRALTGRGEARGGRAVEVAGIAVPARYPAPRDVRALLGPDFVWRASFALGVLVPGPDHAAWTRRHPQAFGLVSALEGIVRAWPVLRSLGDHVVLEGARR